MEIGIPLNVRRAVLIALPLLALFRCGLYGQSQRTILRSITFQGNRALAERQLRELIGSREGSPFSHPQLSRDVGILLDRYRSEGYCLAEITCGEAVYTPDSASADVIIGIREGEQLLLGAIDLEGNTVFTRDDILGGFDTRTGGALAHSVLESDIDRLISRYENAGYPFASVSVLGIEPGVAPAGLRLTLGIEEGRRIRIDEIRVAGNKETDERVIVRLFYHPEEFVTQDPGEPGNVPFDDFEIGGADARSLDTYEYFTRATAGFIDFLQRQGIVLNRDRFHTGGSYL